MGIDEQLRQEVDRWLGEGHTVSELARLAGVPRGNLYAWHKRRASMKVETAARLAQVIGLELVKSSNRRRTRQP